jgi:hypothetical protein
MNRDDVRDYWQQQLDKMNLSGLSMKAWCKANQIPTSSLGYWKRKLATTPINKSQERFVPVQLSSVEIRPSSAPLFIETPRGHRISISDLSQLELLSQVIKVID